MRLILIKEIIIMDNGNADEHFHVKKIKLFLMMSTFM